MILTYKLTRAAIALLAIGVVYWFAAGNLSSWVYFALRGVYFAVRPIPTRCNQRAAELNAKVELIRRDAKNSLKIGTKRHDVVRFFASENIPLVFDQIGQENEASGTIFFKGLAECDNLACGDDSALIGVRVKLDGEGSVASDPVVIGMYTDCL